MTSLGLLLPVIVAVLLLQMLFGGSMLAPETEMTYTEFKTALLLRARRTTLDRLAERLCEHETVNGSEVTAMLAEASTAGANPSTDDHRAPDHDLTPDGDSWQDAGQWQKRAGPAPTDSSTAGELAFTPLFKASER